MPAHPTQLFPVPDNLSDELAVFADPFAVSLHAITRHPPPPGGKVLVYGAGALGTCAVAILRALYPDVEVGVVARFESQGELARKLGASAVFPHAPVKEMIEEAADGRAVCSAATTISRWPTRAGSTWCTTPSRRRRASKSSVALLKAHGTLVKAGVHGPTSWEWTPLYFKEISWVGSNAFGFEEVDGVRKHGIDHYLDLASSGRVDLSDMLTHKFALDDVARRLHRARHPGGLRRDQGRVRPAGRSEATVSRVSRRAAQRGPSGPARSAESGQA